MQHSAVQDARNDEEWTACGRGSDMPWYVLKTKPRQEQRAIDHLQNQAFTVYCPWMVRRDGRREALFTGYLFIQLEQMAESFTRIRSTRGVQAFVKYGEWWATAEATLIEYLKFKENSYRDVPLFRQDQDVVFKDGPFKGIEAVYLCSNGDQRAMVLLTVLNRRQTLVVEEKLLKAV